MDMPDDWLRGLRSWASANGHVRELWLFGSRAQGCSRPDSDVDLAVALTPPRGKNDDPAYGAYVALADEAWKPELEDIVGRHVSLEAIAPDAPGPDWDSMVRCFGVRLWGRSDASFNPMPLLILKRATASRPSGVWKDEDYDVLADGKVVGRIYEQGSASTPPELRWFWSITEIVPSVQNMTHGHAATLDEAKAKFSHNWTKARREAG